jgi:hypothetical protein
VTGKYETLYNAIMARSDDDIDLRDAPSLENAITIAVTNGWLDPSDPSAIEATAMRATDIGHTCADYDDLTSDLMSIYFEGEDVPRSPQFGLFPGNGLGWATMCDIIDALRIRFALIDPVPDQPEGIYQNRIAEHIRSGGTEHNFIPGWPWQEHAI